MRKIRDENINTIENWNEMYLDERRRGHIRTNDGIWDKFLHYLDDGQSIIDVGCGTGGFMVYMRNKRPHMKCAGLDHSIEGINFAKALRADVDYYTSFDDIKDKFRYALSTEVLEHITDNVGFMQKIINLVGVEGLIITTTPFGWDDGEKWHVWDYQSPYDILDLTQGKCEMVDNWIFSRDMCVVMRKVAD